MIKKEALLVKKISSQHAVMKKEAMTSTIDQPASQDCR
jgi:hypothetical protein